MIKGSKISEETRLKKKKLCEERKPKYWTLVNCEYCGKEFLKRNCEIKDRKHNFCSHICADTYNRSVNNYWYGKHFSEELSDKLSLIRKGTRKGSENSQWKGGVKKHGDGYIYLLKPGHPFSTKDGYIMEHRLIMEQSIERYLEPQEIIHHINEIRDDNRIENLMLFASIRKHLDYHISLNKEKTV